MVDSRSLKVTSAQFAFRLPGLFGAFAFFLAADLRVNNVYAQ